MGLAAERIRMKAAPSGNSPFVAGGKASGLWADGLTLDQIADRFTEEYGQPWTAKKVRQAIRFFRLEGPATGKDQN